MVETWVSEEGGVVEKKGKRQRSDGERRCARKQLRRISDDINLS